MKIKGHASAPRGILKLRGAAGFRHMLLLSASFLISSSLTSTDLEARSTGDWPQWRGPSRDGLVGEAPEWPNRIDEQHLRQLWRVKLEPSYSGPIVSGQRVFTTATRDREVEVVTAYERNSGKELWTVEWEGALRVPFFARANGDWIRSTPACDGESLFVAGMRDVLVCLDVENGRERWRFDFVKELHAPLPDFGFVSSSLVDGDTVYVQAGAAVAALDKQTGQLRWHSLKDQGGMWGSAFASPVIGTLGGERQLIVQTRSVLAGLNLGQGEVLWSQPVEAFRGMNILTPTVYRDLLFTSTYGGRTVAFQVVRGEKDFTVTPSWTHKSQGYMSTPLLIDGVIYEHLRSQRMMAIEVETGRELWTTSRSFGKYMSLVAQGKRILALDQRGILLLLQANPEQFELLDERKLADAETWAHLAVAGDQVFVRELNALAAYRWTGTVGE